MRVDERSFEELVCASLVGAGGYDAVKVGGADFDAGRGLDSAELFGFVEETQGREWERLVKLHGGDATSARERFTERLVRELDARGTVDVLRHGVVDLGVAIRLAFFRPANRLTEELSARYAANRLTVTRQLPYEQGSTKTVDLCLLVNGLPVAIAELKNPITGQTLEDAKAQYRANRDPKNVTLSRRAVVHFAVDTELVAMTTRLAGPSTRFLPFNRGSNGGAGNPPNPDGHRTAYLWERVWQRDAWLDLLQRFVHVAPRPKGSRAHASTVFPRYHQWHAVLTLEAAAREEGPGRSYLVEHSAGSGKSNTIAWLAHRLSNLHDDADRKVFDKVVVITDRRVLDRQLQDTIYQFEHAHGVVEKIDENSAQLAAALTGVQARIIITTLQKFPIVFQRGVDLPDRRYAVIVDEAHSSQTGEAAKDLKLVLGDATPEQELTAAEAEDAGFAAEPADPLAEALARAAGARVAQPNLSFFAFTATPKGRTLELFGRLDPVAGKHEPFHLYSMRQAIDEGFILDVLASYVTYQTYWQIGRAVEEDPAYDSSKARSAIARFVSLHEHNLAQKANVIVEHFRTHVQHRVGGRAKAMVVTASRLHALRYRQALRKYCGDRGYGDIGILVAFSGTVGDGDGSWTESKANGFPESQTAAEFATDGWHILVVAEKYQTGFDQPLLYAMYVDKTLTGLAAVQTLSRLNRTHDGKDGTFVLDFRNDADEIRAAFEPWYGKTVAPPTDPNLLYDTRRELDQFAVLWTEETEAAVALLLAPPTATAHGRIHAALTPTIDRFWGLEEAEQDRFRDALNRFVRIYAFLSQVVAFSDAKLERDYLFCKALGAFIKDGDSGGLDLGSEVELTHLRMEQTFEDSVSLDAANGEVTTIFSGTGLQQEPDEEPLSQIIQRLNERYGTRFDPGDRVLYDRVADALVNRTDIQAAAAVNSDDNFKLVVDKEFETGMVQQMEIAEELALSYLDNSGVRGDVLAVYAPLIQGRAKVAYQEHCPISMLLGPDLESQYLEYKSTLRTRAGTAEVFKPLETASLKTIAAFLNSRTGGTLLVGVADDGSVHGLDTDYASLRKEGKDDRDLFQLHLGNIMTQALGAAAATNVATYIHTVDGYDLCRVHVHPSRFPVDAEVTIAKKEQLEKKDAFYVRVTNGTRELAAEERAKYVAGRWGGSPTTP